MESSEKIIKILNEIKDIWLEHPELRLGQLILNVVNDPVLYYMDDEVLTKYLKTFYKNK